MLKYGVIHIDKTGGTSFQEILANAIGPDKVEWWKRKDVKQYLDDQAKHLELNDQKTVLGGHIYYEEFLHMKMNNLKFITWLRHPIDRLLSNYAYFIHRMRTKPENEKQAERANESVLEYADRNETRNKMCRFLNGVKLEELYFFGHLEHFEEDVQRFSDLSRIDNLKLVHTNTNEAVKKEVLRLDKSTLQKLVAYNEEDMELYYESLQLLHRSPQSKYIL